MITFWVLGVALAQTPAPLLVAPERGPEGQPSPAQPLPARVVVCVDAATGRCRVEADAETCGPGEEEFRTILPGDADAALLACREAHRPNPKAPPAGR